MTSARRKLGALLVVAIAALLQPGVATPVRAEDDGDPAQQLVDRFAPIIRTVAQDGQCDRDGEQFVPASVDAVLGNPEVLLRQVGTDDPVVKVGPTAADLFRLGEGFFIDFPGSSLEPGCVYERDIRRYTEDLPSTVYGHVVTQPDRPDQLVVQYWFYWYYNDWNNKHESDWEGIQLLFDTGSIDEALQGEPVSVGFAQHEGGESAPWDSDKLEREGQHPVVYPSAGSHASYYEPDLHLGRGAREGFGCDTTVGPSVRHEPVVVLLPDSVDDPDDPLAWLAYEGRWGERQRGAFNGPTGPITKPRWTHPVDWHEDLRPSSVLIPGGDSTASEIIMTFCAVVERGSGALIVLSVSPLQLVLFLVAAAALAWWLVRRTDWSAVSPQPLRRARRGGQILRASFAMVRRSSLIRRLGIVWLPVTVVVGLVGRVVASLPFVRQFIELAGTGGITGLVIAITLAGSGGLVAFVGLNAAVAVHLESLGDDEASLDERHSVDATLLAVWRRRRPLLLGLLRVYLTVVALALTVFGVPWAIRRIVRSQFVPHVIMVEGLDARAAIERSGRLVAGRWWHTAAMVLMVNAFVGVVAVVAGLLLLVLFAALPLWFFSAVLSVAYATVSPVAAVAMTFLYGDAVAADQSAAGGIDVDGRVDVDAGR